MLTPSTPFAYPQVLSRPFESSDSEFLQVSAISVAGSIRCSSTKTSGQRFFLFDSSPHINTSINIWGQINRTARLCDLAHGGETVL